MERDPIYVVVANEPRWHHQLGEPDRVDPEIPVPVEIDPLPPKQLHRVVRVGVSRHVEVSEIEFPNIHILGAQIRQIAIVVREREADLNQIQTIDVGLEHEVVRVGFPVTECRVVGVGSDNDARKLGVHWNQRVIVDDGPDQFELGVEVIGPDRPGQDA